MNLRAKDQFFREEMLKAEIEMEEVITCPPEVCDEMCLLAQLACVVRPINKSAKEGRYASEEETGNFMAQTQLWG